MTTEPDGAFRLENTDEKADVKPTGVWPPVKISQDQIEEAIRSPDVVKPE